MIITKKPNKDDLARIVWLRIRPLKFSCDLCGCEFIATNTEYGTKTSGPEIATVYEIGCPGCGKMISTYHPEYVTVEEMAEHWNL